eukprot:TRINITY_DN5958_c0_g1_i1.p2 TRINITY_DN5958_c0_g1~~TRINITY_DN5958_c0_g1_i1.p2  ORF type:complete len:75 (-),score=8.17 TRINITY_DN5958_c0_g1_i1:9-206(-)
MLSASFLKSTILFCCLPLPPFEPTDCLGEEAPPLAILDTWDVIGIATPKLGNQDKQNSWIQMNFC